MNTAAPPPAAEGGGRIAIRLTRAVQLFNTLDPSPFREGELAADAEAYILDWARELPHATPIAILVHLPEAELAGPDAARIPDAIRGFFAARAARETQEIRELFHHGRRVLAVGMLILAACLLLAWQASQGLAAGTFSRVLQESLVILGWVAIWRPAELFLFDWMPHARRRRLFRRLAVAEVTLKAAG